MKSGRTTPMRIKLGLSIKSIKSSGGDHFDKSRENHNQSTLMEKQCSHHPGPVVFVSPLKLTIRAIR
jgi:hypothetical protein